MKICAALCFYLEPPSFLTRCVASLAGIADHLVALDGPWRLFPDAGMTSTDAEYAAIQEMAAAGGLGLTIEAPDEPYENQVAKRAALMALAAEHGDWVIVVDGDEYVSRGLPLGLRFALERTDCVAGEVLLRNWQGPQRLGGGLARRVYRAGTTVETVHSGYTYEGRHLLPGEPTVDLRDIVTVEHDFRNRGEERNQQAAVYLERRAAEREEVWV